jgi:HNH endonuclease/NUMOD4 motif
MEVWIAYPENNFYEVSSLGRVRSASSKRVLKAVQRSIKNKYLAISVCDRQGGKTTCYVHHMIASAFLQPKPCKNDEIDHINSDKQDNRAENLRWASVYQNNQRKVVGKRSVVSHSFVGVDKVSKTTFRARVSARGVYHHLGNFKTAEEAARAYDAFVRSEFGDKARTNFD